MGGVAPGWTTMSSTGLLFIRVADEVCEEAWDHGSGLLVVIQCGNLLHMFIRHAVLTIQLDGLG